MTKVQADIPDETKNRLEMLKEQMGINQSEALTYLIKFGLRDENLQSVYSMIIDGTNIEEEEESEEQEEEQVDFNAGVRPQGPSDVPEGEASNAEYFQEQQDEYTLEDLDDDIDSLGDSIEDMGKE